MIKHNYPNEEQHRSQSSLWRGYEMGVGMGEPCCLLPRGGLEGREGALGTWCLKTTLWKNPMERSNVTETNGESSGWRLWGSSKNSQCPGIWTSKELPVLEAYHTLPQSVVIWVEIWDDSAEEQQKAPKWACCLDFSLYFIFLLLKGLCFGVLWYPLYTKTPDVPHLRGKDFQRVTGNMLPPFHNLEISQ